ncbi:unnamed protein product [Closterium sp. Naga37s-1]|nr:unnamed protein product [Closterium sp. Naga37s-1]
MIAAPPVDAAVAAALRGREADLLPPRPSVTCKRCSALDAEAVPRAQPVRAGTAAAALRAPPLGHAFEASSAGERRAEACRGARRGASPVAARSGLIGPSSLQSYALQERVPAPTTPPPAHHCIHFTPIVSHHTTHAAHAAHVLDAAQASYCSRPAVHTGSIPSPTNPPIRIPHAPSAPCHALPLPDRLLPPTPQLPPSHALSPQLPLLLATSPHCPLQNSPSPSASPSHPFPHSPSHPFPHSPSHPFPPSSPHPIHTRSPPSPSHPLRAHAPPMPLLPSIPTLRQAAFTLDQCLVDTCTNRSRNPWRNYPVPPFLQTPRTAHIFATSAIL